MSERALCGGLGDTAIAASRVGVKKRVASQCAKGASAGELPSAISACEKDTEFPRISERALCGGLDDPAIAAISAYEKGTSGFDEFDG